MTWITARPSRIAILPVVLIGTLALAACSGGGSPSPSSSPGSPDSPAPGSPDSPAPGAVTSVDDAVARIAAERPDLADMGPFDPDRIGGCCWYKASKAEDGYEILYRVGWGDCPSGCIDEHTWTFQVAADGSVELVAEGGDPIPPGGIPEGGIEG